MHDLADAIDLRGTLEGLAARMADEQGVRRVLLQEAGVVFGPERPVAWAQQVACRNEALMHEQSCISHHHLGLTLHNRQNLLAPAVQLFRIKWSTVFINSTGSVAWFMEELDALGVRPMGQVICHTRSSKRYWPSA